MAGFVSGGGPVAEGATDASAWLAAASKLSGRDAHRVVKRAAVIDALPALGDALAAGAVSVGHVDVVASVVPATLWAQAGELVDVAVLVSPEELRLRAQRFVADRDRDRGAARHERLKAGQSVSFFGTDAGMGAMFGQWDPATAASVENAVDLIADEMWRALHPDRNPTRHEATSLKWRRADAVVEIARRVLDGRLAANADADGEGRIGGVGAGEAGTPRPSIGVGRGRSPHPRR